MKLVLVLLSAVTLLLSSNLLFASEGMDQGNGSMMMEQSSTDSASKAVEVGNKICPVSGEEVGKMGQPFKYEYNGKVYNLCCPMCVKDFKKNPEKYSKIAEDEVAKENKK